MEHDPPLRQGFESQSKRGFSQLVPLKPGAHEQVYKPWPLKVLKQVPPFKQGL